MIKSFSSISIAAVCCLLGFAAILRGSPTTSATVSAWHPANWDTTLPPGVGLTDASGFRIVPDVSITPGVADPNVTLAELASPAYIKAKRNVPASEKDAVWLEYLPELKDATGKLDRKRKADKCAALHTLWPTERYPFEVDHDISLENGGLNDLGNLWLQPYFGAWNAHDKDKLEDYLHAQVKAGSMTLSEDQDDLRGFHWVWSYLHFFGQPSDSAH